jgi:uncharacterized protein (DUF58 family)
LSSPIPAAFLAKLERLRLVTRRQHLGRFSARNRSSKMGRGLEFAAHRPYTPGDDFKDVDWNLYGRLERFYVRQAHEETELDITLMVDVSRSMTAGDPPKSRMARELATALAYLGLARLDRVRLAPFGGDLHPPLSLPRRKAQAIAAYRSLEELSANADPASNLLRSAQRLAAVTKARGLVLILSDFLCEDGWLDAVQVLRLARFEPALIQIASPDEVDPPLAGELHLLDSESGRALRVEVDEGLKRRYQREFNVFSEGLARFAREHGLAYSHVVSDQDLDQAVFETLRLGGVVG